LSFQQLPRFLLITTHWTWSFWGEIFSRPSSCYCSLKFKPWQIEQTIHLTHIILPAQICFILGALLHGESLQRTENFLIPAWDRIIYNLSIIFDRLASEQKRLGLEGLCWGVLFGHSQVTFALQAFYAKRIGIRYRSMLKLRHPSVIKVGKLALPNYRGSFVCRKYSQRLIHFRRTSGIGDDIRFG